jgi:hypothetical protein
MLEIGYVIFAGVMAGMAFISGCLVASLLAGMPKEKKQSQKYQEETVRLMEERNEIDTRLLTINLRIAEALEHAAYQKGV